MIGPGGLSFVSELVQVCHFVYLFTFHLVKNTLHDFFKLHDHFALMGNFDIIFMQVETVAQFGVIFLLFALGLEFSSAKVPYPTLPPPHPTPSPTHTNTYLHTLNLSLYIIAATCCSSSCCFRRSPPDISFYVLVWSNCCGIYLFYHVSMLFLLNYLSNFLDLGHCRK